MTEPTPGVKRQSELQLLGYHTCRYYLVAKAAGMLDAATRVIY
jgi:hypothetical protein